MDGVLRQASRFKRFTFVPLPLGPGEITEEAAIEAASRGYPERPTEAAIYAAHGRYDDGGTGIIRLPSGERIAHQNRLVWLVAFVGLEVVPEEGRRGVHLQVIDAASGRRLKGYRWPFPQDRGER